MNKKIAAFLILTLPSFFLYSQNESLLSSSPYSLFGLGVANEINTGGMNGLNKFGFAIKSGSYINNSNPSSFGSIPLNSFLFDFGFKTQTEKLYKGSSEESRLAANFSNIAIAFPLSKTSKIGVVLSPYTNVGYYISGIESNIEGSNDTYLTEINGSGGINNFKINYAYKINNKFNIGLSASILFGQINETTTNYIYQEIVTIEDKKNYSGFRIGGGFQYELSKNITIGSIINFPVSLNGRQVSLATQVGQEEVEFESDIDDFKLPFEFGIGINTKINDYLNVNFDYKKNLWGPTNQSDQLGDFVNQNLFGFGLEFKPKRNRSKFLSKLQYRTGFNFDSGNIEIDNQNIKNYSLNLGLGIPLNNMNNSMINIGYSYGQKGQISNGLIKELYHLVSINLSLEGIWFKKRKFL